jgi:hypothetical protein
MILPFRIIKNDVEESHSSISCSEGCNLYDGDTDQCGVFGQLDLNDPQMVKQCALRVGQPLTTSNEGSDQNYPLLTKGIFQGSIEEENKSYPFAPSHKTTRKDANWFVSQDQTFGCWIINHSDSHLMVVSESDLPTDSKKYRSPFPLHNHNSSDSLTSNMCWYVDESGVGSYTLLIQSDILKISP